MGDALFHGEKVTSVLPHGPTGAGEFVCERDGGNVVATSFFELQCPGTQAVWRVESFGMTEHGSGAVDEEHSQVSVAAFGDATEAAGQSAGMFPWSQADVACEVTTRAKALHITDESEEGGGGQKTDTGDGAQTSDDGVVFGECFELTFGVTDAPFDVTNLGTRLPKCVAQGERHSGLGIFDQRVDGGHEVPGTGGNDDTEFAQDAASGVDAGGTLGDVCGSVSMKGGQDMLVDRLDGNGMDVFVAVGFEQGFGIGTIRFVSGDVGAHGVRGQEDDLVSEAL